MTQVVKSRMENQKYRISKGGEINRSKPLNFTFNGKSYRGFKGDTLASALLANGIHLIGRSFKYHRPRGILSAGIEEPNGLVQLEKGSYTEPNIQCTRIYLYEGLTAKSQNCWPSVKFDINAINSKFEKLIPAGFYYKTFMWPKNFWRFYEYLIRKVAGMGVAPENNDPVKYVHRYSYCDVLIIGAGPSGIAAALQASASNARVILVESDPSMGGGLRTENKKIDEKPAMQWVTNAEHLLESKENVTVLKSTIAVAYYDHNMIILNQYSVKAPPAQTGQCLWLVRAKRVILATGSIERPIVFSNNDRPGIMLMSSVVTYAKVFATRAGTRAVIFTNNNSVYPAIETLISSGIKIEIIVDSRLLVPADCEAIAAKNNVSILRGHTIDQVNGKNKIKSVQIARINPENNLLHNNIIIKCNLLCISGGWTPSVHLFSQSQGKLRYDTNLTAFIPNKSMLPQQSIGSCNGKFSLVDCLTDGSKAGLQAVEELDFKVSKLATNICSEEIPFEIEALWIAPSKNSKKKFVDFQNDVTADDIALAYRENYLSVEHLKRYTTLGMGTDQGRLSNVNGLAIMAQLRDLEIQDVGTTTFRPPFTPITMGAVAGSEVDQDFIPIRRSSMYQNHKTWNAKFVRAGQWLRPQYYIVPNEDSDKTIANEALHTRHHVGIIDVSTLGKIEIKGADSEKFLSKIYINNFDNMKIGTCRYGVMLREDGMVFDDGTITKIKESHFLITTTTLKAGPVLQHMEFFSQVEWPELDVHLLSVTEEWSAIAIAGPHSREVLSKIIKDIDLSNSMFPFMAFQEGIISDIPIRIFRISFSGELAYEINIPSNFGADLWELLLKAGKNNNIRPYGTDAMNILRIEKGHVVGGEINGRTTANDLGFGSMINFSKDFIGKRALERPGLKSKLRAQLVGLKPIDIKAKIPPAGRIIRNQNYEREMESEGEVTSCCFSPIIGHSIALALVLNGFDRLGEVVQVVSPLLNQSIKVEICQPTFFDAKGSRLRA